MQCPRCKAAESLKVEIYEGIEIDRCTNCNGVWLDEGELLKIIDATEEVFSTELVEKAISAAFAGIPLEESELESNCPKCSESMHPVNYAYSSGVIFDRCPEAHGLWLDGEELDKVQIHHEHWENEKAKNKNEWMRWVKVVENNEQIKAAPKKGQGPIRHVFSSIAEKLFSK